MKTYLCIVGLLSFIALVQSGAIDRLGECAKEFSVTEDEILGAVTFKKSSAFENPKVRCVFACALKKEGRLVDGKISIDKELNAVRELWPEGTEEVRKEIVTECANQGNQEKDECDVAGVYTKCLCKTIARKDW